MPTNDEKMRRLSLRKRNLLRQLTKQGDSLVNGTVHVLYAACNKGNCKCTKGKPHGPKYYLVWNENKKPKLFYVRKNEIKVFKKGVASYAKAKELLKEVAHLNLLSHKLRRNSEGK